MKKTITIIVIVMMLLSLVACDTANRNDGTMNVTSAELIKATEKIQTTSEPVKETESIETTTEPTKATETTEGENENKVFSDFIENLHPLYQLCGYPDADATAFIEAEEVVPTIEFQLPCEWVKCVYTGTFTHYDSNGDKVDVEINVYTYIADGSIGTFIINDKGAQLNFYGWACDEETSNGYNICLKDVHCAEECGECGVWVFPYEDSFMLVAHPHYEDGTKIDIGDEEYFDNVAEVDSTVDAECPYEKAKCVYSMPYSDWRDGQKHCINTDVYLYINYGIIGTWIVTDEGYDMTIYGWAYTHTDSEYCIELIKPYFPESFSFLVFPEEYGYLVSGEN